MARLAAGERDEPLIELYRRYGPRLYALGVRLLGERGQAEELVQETFIRVWQSAGRFDGDQASPRSWLLMLARRVAVDMQRRAAARPRAAEHRLSGDREPDNPLERIPAEDELDALLLSLEVRAMVDGLSAHHREVIRLAYDDELTQREIAERLEIPLGTVKTRTYHALRELKAICEERGAL